MSSSKKMSSNRPYLLRAMYQWISDNGMTPYILVDAGAEGVQVPASAVKDGRVVLNIAGRAVTQLGLENSGVRFLARFGGVSHNVDVPISAVLAVYAHENGQGMMFPVEGASAPEEPPPEKKGPHLRVVK